MKNGWVETQDTFMMILLYPFLNTSVQLESACALWKMLLEYYWVHHCNLPNSFPPRSQLQSMKTLPSWSTWTNMMIKKMLCLMTWVFGRTMGWTQVMIMFHSLSLKLNSSRSSIHLLPVTLVLTLWSVCIELMQLTKAWRSWQLTSIVRHVINHVIVIDSIWLIKCLAQIKHLGLSWTPSLDK